jgi:hypothetical protein
MTKCSIAGCATRGRTSTTPALPRGSSRNSWRAIILFVVTVLGSGTAYVLSDGARFITVNLTRAAMLPPLWVFAGVATIGFLTMGLALTAAVAQARQS